MALKTQRYNYKGHDIYVFGGTTNRSMLSPGHRDCYSTVVMVDGKILGATIPPMWFTKDSDTYVLEDGVQIHVDGKAKIFTEDVKIYADGVELIPEEMHNRKYENLKRLAENYKALGPLTDEQFLAIKSLSSPVILHTGKEKLGIIPAISLNAHVKELHSDEFLKKSSDLTPPTHLYLVQPGDSVVLTMDDVNGITRPFQIYYDGYDAYVDRISAEVDEMHMPNGTKGFSDCATRAWYNVPFVMDGTITLGEDEIVVDGCITSIDYRQALRDLEKTLSQMPEEVQIAYVNSLKEIVNESTTLVEFKTIKDLAERGYELSDSLLLEIANQDREWQECLTTRFFDQPDIELDTKELSCNRER